MNNLNFNKNKFFNKFYPDHQIYECSNFLDDLIYQLSPEVGKPWNIRSLASYLNFVYKRASKKDVESSCDIEKNIYIKEEGNYIYMNTNLLNKNSEEIYVKANLNEHNCEFVTGKDISIPRVKFYEEKDLSYFLQSPNIKLPSLEKENIDNKLERRKQILNIINEKRRFSIVAKILCRIKSLKENLDLTDELKFELKNDERTLINKIIRKKDIGKKELNIWYGEELKKLNLENVNDRKVTITKDELFKILICCKDEKFQDNVFRSNNNGEPNRKKGNNQSNGLLHIILDGSDNLLTFLNYFLGKDYHLDKYQIQSDIIKGGEKSINSLKEIIDRAITNTLNRQKTDKSLIAPIYFENFDKISYILPLYISHREKPDCALLFNKEEDENERVKYVPTTLLNMEEAYIDVRLLGTVDMYPWLQ